MLYRELLAAPGVLAPRHGHYACEIESLAKNAANLIERILERAAAAPSSAASAQTPTRPIASAVPLPIVPVTDAARELRHLQPLLAAIAGPSVRLSIASMPCAGRTALSVEDLTRTLVNLVRNAADAMPSGGSIRITAQYGNGLNFVDRDIESKSNRQNAPRSIIVAVTDNGPGIPASLREQVFDLGFSGHKHTGRWPAPRRRGLGLSIVRTLVESAGGAVRIAPALTRGTCIEFGLPLYEPITSGTCPTPLLGAFATDSTGKGCIECK
jgi:signal transduction histidine kinase